MPPPAHTPLSHQIPHEIPNPTHCQPQPLLTRKRQQKAPLAGSRKAAENGALELGCSNREKSRQHAPGAKPGLSPYFNDFSILELWPTRREKRTHLRPRRQSVFKTQFNNFSILAITLHLSEEVAPNYLPSIGRAPNAAASFPSCFLLQIQHIGIGLHHRRKQRLAVFSALRLQQRTNSIFSAYCN